MSDKKTYSEKLKDPRWQRMRLKILERDSWKCRWCDEADNTLHVHHTYYERGKEPWDYPPESLLTLCENCHQFEYESRKEAEDALLFTLRERGFSTEFVYELFDVARRADMGVSQFWLIRAIDAVASNPAMRDSVLDSIAPGWREPNHGL